MKRRRGRRYKRYGSDVGKVFNEGFVEWFNRTNRVGETIRLNGREVVVESPAYLDEDGIPAIELDGCRVDLGMVVS